MKKMTMVLLLSFLFSGCTSKEIIFEEKLICKEQLQVPKPKAEIKVYPEYLDRAKSFIESAKETYRFYYNQVEENNKLCKEFKIERD